MAGFPNISSTWVLREFNLYRTWQERAPSHTLWRTRSVAYPMRSEMTLGSKVSPANSPAATFLLEQMRQREHGFPQGDIE
jgi:hypothetical protein